MAQPLIAADDAARPPVPAAWADEWDAKVGLWIKPGPGHTWPVAELSQTHPAPDAATRLMGVAMANRLGEIDAPAVLRTLRQMQATDGGPQHGCFRWYWEEPGPVDTNAAFFTGLALITTRLAFAERLEQQLDIQSMQTFDAMLTDLSRWFDGQMVHHPRHYPNKYLGDLVCRWLLIEALDQQGEVERVSQEMLVSARYWREQHWGWGEHMSNIYTMVMLDQLSALLLLSNKLPPEVRQAYVGLRDDLLAIEDAYGHGPRVPVIRDYSFEKSPANNAAHYRNYRDQIEAFGPTSKLPSGNINLRPVLASLGWHDHVPPRATPVRQSEISVACFGSIKSVGYVDGPLRLGTLSRFPLMPEMEHPTWGLSWQSFPVTLWHETGGWGFMQWQTQIDGQVRAHPAQSKNTAYLNNAITFDRQPPISGRTYAVQRGPLAVVLRTMPEIHGPWESLADGFRLVDSTAKIVEIPSREGNSVWSQITIDFGSPQEPRVASVHHVSLDGKRPVVRRAEDGSVDWQVRYSREEMRAMQRVVNLWAIGMMGEIENAPILRKVGEGAWELDWDFGGGMAFRLMIEPGEKEPLRVR